MTMAARPRMIRPPQLTLGGLAVLVAEAALVSAAAAELSSGELRLAIAVGVLPLIGAAWGALRSRETVVGAFRCAVFAGALQSALFAVCELARLFLGWIGHPDLNAAAVVAYETAIVLVTSLFLGAVLSLMVGAAVRLGRPVPQPDRQSSARAADGHAKNGDRRESG